MPGLKLFTNLIQAEVYIYPGNRFKQEYNTIHITHFYYNKPRCLSIFKIKPVMAGNRYK